MTHLRSSLIIYYKTPAPKPSPPRPKQITAKPPNTFQNRFHFFTGISSMPSSSCGTNGPSLHSKMTETDSMDSSLCQTFLGISTPYTPSSWLKTTLSMTFPSSLYVVEQALHPSTTNGSSLVECR